MPKYWVKNYFAHRRFPEVGQKQKTEKRKRLNDGNNNGQATHGARKHACMDQPCGLLLSRFKIFHFIVKNKLGQSKAKLGVKILFFH